MPIFEMVTLIDMIRARISRYAGTVMIKGRATLYERTSWGSLHPCMVRWLTLRVNKPCVDLGIEYSVLEVMSSATGNGRPFLSSVYLRDIGLVGSNWLTATSTFISENLFGIESGLFCLLPLVSYIVPSRIILVSERGAGLLLKRMLTSSGLITIIPDVLGKYIYPSRDTREKPGRKLSIVPQSLP